MKTKTKTITIMGEIRYTKEVVIQWDEEDHDGFRNAANNAVVEAEETPKGEWVAEAENVTSICYSE